MPCVIWRNGRKEDLHLKSVTTIDPVTGWFEIAQYHDKRAISIEKWIETMWLSIYLTPM